MEFERGEIVRVKPGEHDHGHDGEKGKVIDINTNPVNGVLATDHYTGGMPEEAEAYQVAFPSIESWKLDGVEVVW